MRGRNKCGAKQVRPQKSLAVPAPYRSGTRLLCVEEVIIIIIIIDGRAKVWYLSGVVPGPAESALSTHVLSGVYTAFAERD